MKAGANPFIMRDEHERIVQAREAAVRAVHRDSRETSFLYGLVSGFSSGLLIGMLFTSWAVWYVASV